MNPPLRQSTQARILREQVIALHAMTVSSVVADVTIVMVLSLTFYVQLNDSLALIWLGIHMAQLMCSIPFGVAYTRDPQAANRSAYWATIKARTLIADSCSWGLAPWLLMPHDNLPMTMLIVLFILSMCSGAVPAVAPRKDSLLGFTLPMTTSLIAALAWHGGGIYWALAGCCLVYLLVTLQFASTHNKLLTDALIMRFEKEALTEKLSEQIAIAQSASDEKTRFLSAASHDLRQPLHAIVLFGAVLDKELCHLPQHAHVLRQMDAVQALSVSLDSMLDVSQLDAGVIQPKMQAAALAPMLETVNNMFAARANEKGLELRVRTSPLWVQTDPHLLQRILANLIENALKFTLHGGVIVTARPRGQEVWLEVRDSGMGIAADHFGKIFDEFYQVGNAGRSRARGLGIGLAVVRRLSRLMGYSVQVQSREGRGSRFRVVLPGAPRSAAALPTMAHTPMKPDVAATLPQRVLVIDDEADTRDAIAALLNLHGVAVVTAANEAQARAALAHAAHMQQPFEALVSDYRLEAGKDGLKVALLLRTAFAPALPLLIITGETAPARLQRIHDVGVPVLFKPVAAEVLLDALANLIK